QIASLFHGVENNWRSPPDFSIAWKLFIPRGRDFSTVWNFYARFFHSVEKHPQSCSIVWKIRRKFFHCVELLGLIFPQYGTNLPDFSTVWKIIRNAGSTSGKIILLHRNWAESSVRQGLQKPKRQQPGLPRYRADGVEAVPPEGGNSRRCKGSDCSRGR
ncbi:MAG TPA: hypothetical protein PLJ22_02135, partial [Kiritimatiellia bacterium]|nr:hypothetical protein [Kiritimatiellia bacterium]